MTGDEFVILLIILALLAGTRRSGGRVHRFERPPGPRPRPIPPPPR